MSRAFPALVVSVGKNAAWVVLDEEHAARIADLKRATGKRAMLAPGDRIEVSILDDGRVLVERVAPRSVTLQRRTSGGRSKTMAANVDTMVTVTALTDPPPRLATLDQLLAFAELEEIAAIVVLTKPDIAEGLTLATIESLYRSLGYKTMVLNPKRGAGVEELREILVGRRALLCGVSGVGKSSLFRALGGEAVIGDLSRHGLGRQTTSAARLYRLPNGFLIDSPGVAEFGLGNAKPADLARAFRDLRKYSADCRFSDCTHLHEPDCAVRHALVKGDIAESRYASYRRILEANPRVRRGGS